MKRNLLIIAVLVVLVLITGPVIMVNSSTAKGVKMENKKIIIVYYSHSGNTKKVAEQIQKKTGGVLFEIKTVQKYPENYDALIEQAKKEKQDDFKPALQKNIENIGQYDVIFIGTPVWWYTMAPAVKSFVFENKMDNKIVVPFCTHGGGGASATFTDMQKLAPEAKVLQGLQIYEHGDENTSKEIENWIDNLKL